MMQPFKMCCPYAGDSFLKFLTLEGYKPDEIAKALWLLEDSYECLSGAECKEESDDITDDIEENFLELEELYTRYQQQTQSKMDMAAAFKSIYDVYCFLERYSGREPEYTVSDEFWVLYMSAEDEDE